ncbi:PEP-CTERM sorting domain-containing protein [Desulfobacter postgatei]|uniref:PEP-CTERM putative exosortase interaction domain-containing protein n=1 Tax=Desulfobacter postgatei 2ac9 TaxID=879212 RepID=I5AZP1_9BACT|nr:PEP-CTERM sorting domain-containing protein [Desulfobacter postgatei]EIM62704.1 PEP-CTERM putative exosortase interaction domain-containing protein [Desulfobacter postgatei 2ac9]
MKSKVFLVCCFLLFLFISIPEHAMSYSSTEIRLAKGEFSSSTVVEMEILNSAFDWSHTEAASSLEGIYEDGARTIEDLTISDTITYSGEASSSSTALKSKVSGEKVTEYIEATDSISGIANVEVSAYAYFADALTVSGAIDLSYIQFSVSIEGYLSDYNAYVSVKGSGIDLWLSGADLDGETSLDIDLVSDLLEIDNGEVYISLRLETYIDFWLGYYEEEGTAVELTADFFNTVTIGQFSGYNDAGELVDLSSVVGSDGHVYDTLRVESAPVPEPTTFLLFGLGILGVAGMSRKKTA